MKIMKVRMFFNKNTKPFIFGLTLGAIIASGMLDNRFGAMVKGFIYPIHVNAMPVETEVVIKK